MPQSIILGQAIWGPGRNWPTASGPPGIAATSILRLSMAKLNNVQVQVIGIDPASYLKVANFDWNAGSSDAAVTQLGTGRWVIANAASTPRRTVWWGQQLRLDTPNARGSTTWPASGNDYLNAKLSTLYTSQAN